MRASSHALAVALGAGDLRCIRQASLDGVEGPTIAGRCGVLGRFDDSAADEVLLDTPTAIRRVPGGEVCGLQHPTSAGGASPSPQVAGTKLP